MLPLLNSWTCKLSSSSGVKLVKLNLIIIMCYFKLADSIRDSMKMVSPNVKEGDSKADELYYNIPICTSMSIFISMCCPSLLQILNPITSKLNTFICRVRSCNVP